MPSLRTLPDERLDGREARQRVGHFDARKALLAFAIANHHGQVEAEVGDVRKRAARIDGQRRQHRIHHLIEILVDFGFLLVGQRGVIQNVNARLIEFGQQLLLQISARIVHQA